ncbi:hypothetical protein A259_36080 [Pseudomonas syringae pv. actinidiae ICMP 19070]|nr:hypothetical protein A259_36080 [Pseudomonas syringae pv. actinidiae ICMP 19070]
MTIPVISTNEVVIVYPIFITGIVRRVDIDNPYFAPMSSAKKTQGVKIITFNNEIAFSVRTTQRMGVF